MSLSHRISSDGSAYRRGLVLGLTMAEAVLLIVFALLIALAAIWRAEQASKEALVREVQQHAQAGLARDQMRSRVMDKIEALLSSPERSKFEAVVERMAAGDDVAVVGNAEAARIAEIERRLPGGEQPEIDETWRELTVAAGIKNLGRKLALAEAVDKATDGRMDPSAVAEVIALGLRGRHDWPPIISLREAEGYRFATGRAELTPAFEQNLKTVIIPKLLTETQKYEVDVDVIEVIGHTDGQITPPRTSNLDRWLLDALNGGTSMSHLTFGDNAGLGLGRAVSVARALTLDGRLQKFRILPLSGGHLIQTDEHISGGGTEDSPNRRRIEIRLRRSQDSLELEK
jgi:outer membrane protein OmpA-like peptidoglycan-associated protein